MPSKLAKVSGRNEFGLLLNKLDLLGTAVEIGTHRGIFAASLLNRWKGKLLYCVDPWIHGYDKGDPASQGNREADYQEAVNRLSGFNGRVQILKTTSVLAAKQIPDNSLDFVYIDGCHQPKNVKEDSETWWPKLRRGGLLAGHDIVSGTKPGRGWDQYIRPIISRLARTNNTDLWLVPELPGKNWSYFIIKP